ncbi:shikimate kinase [Krasilnikovia sp. M28-CT-15]|uniref:shikimate kinase n=1 Tax=Krasilnikovia sp. M28-CT-15 TaxID=3373540 RepID=UPI0038768096
MFPVAVLVGPPGAGKTTIGLGVASALGVAFADTDSIIEERAGKPIPDIFAEDGEPAFRVLEREVVASSLASFAGVLALGGGAVLDEATRKLLREHTVVFLSVGLSDAVRRVGLGAGRPLLATDPHATMKVLLEQRRRLYVEVARHTVTTDGREPVEIAAEVVATLHHRTP